MNALWAFFFGNKLLSDADKELALQLEQILAFKTDRINYYKLALRHKSHTETNLPTDNERLEFLGDAILGAAVAEYLYKKYPYENEGFLTELRSKIVRRDSMNTMAMRMGLNRIVMYNRQDRVLNKSQIFGNALEALIGAIFLDKGYNAAKSFIIKELINTYQDLDDLQATDTNYKNQLQIWAQRHGHTYSIDQKEEIVDDKQKRLFVMAVYVNGEEIATGAAYNKKDAGKVAAQKALAIINAKDESESGTDE